MSFLVRGWHLFRPKGTAVQQTDTSIEGRRGQLIAALERKLEQLQKDLRARDREIAEPKFQIARLETRMFELFDKQHSAGTRS